MKLFLLLPLLLIPSLAFATSPILNLTSPLLIDNQNFSSINYNYTITTSKTYNYPYLVKIQNVNSSNMDFLRIDCNNANTTGLVLQDSHLDNINLNSIGQCNKNGILFNATNTVSLLDNTIRINAIGQGNSGIYFDATKGVIQGNQVFCNFISGSRFGFFVNETGYQFSNNEIHCSNVDNYAVPNSYVLYSVGSMNGNTFDVETFANSGTIIGGNANYYNYTNQANFQNVNIRMFMENSNVSIFGALNNIVNNNNQVSGYIDSPIIASNNTTPSNFNSGSPLWSNKVILGMKLPAMTTGQTVKRYFFDSLIDGPSSSIRSSAINYNGYEYEISRIQSEENSHEHMISVSVTSLGNYPSNTIQELFEINN